MFCTIRQYEGCTDNAEALKLVQSDLLPAIRDMAGYQSYIATDCGNGTLVSISVFETREQAEAANEQVAPLLAKSLAAFLPKPPTRIVGEIIIENRK